MRKLLARMLREERIIPSILNGNMGFGYQIDQMDSLCSSELPIDDATYDTYRLVFLDLDKGRKWKHPSGSIEQKKIT